MGHTRLLAGALAAALVFGTSAAPAQATTGELPATDTSVSLTVDGTTAYGTLHIPAHRAGQRLAAALLLPGSGPTDRNGNEPALNYDPNTLALLAGVLGDQGIMSLRFDKYFSGQTGGGAYATDPGRIDLGAYVRQADGAYDLLRDQPQTDRARLLVVGHSEGGLTGMLVAESVSPRPAGLALLEPQDLRLLDLILIQTDEQLRAQAAAGAITEAVEQANEFAAATAVARFRAGQPVDTTGMLPWVATLYADELFSRYNTNYVRSDDAIVPAQVASRLAPGTRVLVTCGTAEKNVPCWTTPALVAGLAAAHTGGPGLVVLPEVDHYLHPAGTPLNAQILAPSLISALTAFVARR